MRWEWNENYVKRNQERQDGQEDDFYLERGMGNQTIDEHYKLVQMNEMHIKEKSWKPSESRKNAYQQLIEKNLNSVT